MNAFYSVLSFSPNPEEIEHVNVALCIWSRDTQIIYDEDFPKLKCISPRFDLNLIQFYLDDIQQSIGNTPREQWATFISTRTSQFRATVPRQLHVYPDTSIRRMLVARYLQNPPRSVESGVLIDQNGEPIYWHTPHGSTEVSLPESYDLWEIIWENRANLQGFAHSHPGSGVPSPSYTDVTTFAAIELGLGKRLIWWVISRTHTVEVIWEGPGKLDYKTKEIQDLPWVEKLRELSYTNAKSRETY